MEIRSYRRVFDLERRIYRVDRLRLNPGGVPVRGVVYFLVAVCAALIVGQLPLVGVAAKAAPWYLRDLVLPGASATVLSVIRVEGRPFHMAAHALVRYRMGVHWLSGFRRCVRPGGSWDPGEVLFLPDGSDAKMRRLRYTGPGAVLIVVAHERVVRAPRSTRSMWPGTSPSVVLRELEGRRPLDHGQVITIGPRARLLVQTASAEKR